MTYAVDMPPPESTTRCKVLMRKVGSTVASKLHVMFMSCASDNIQYVLRSIYIDCIYSSNAIFGDRCSRIIVWNPAEKMMYLRMAHPGGGSRMAPLLRLLPFWCRHSGTYFPRYFFSPPVAKRETHRQGYTSMVRLARLSFHVDCAEAVTPFRAFIWS